MKLICNFFNNRRQHRPDILLILIGVTLPFTISIGNTAIIIAFLASVFLIFRRSEEKVKLGSVAFIFPLLFFIWISISALASKDISAGLKQVDKNSLYLLIAISIAVLYKGEKAVLKNILTGFSVSVLLAALVLMITGLYDVLTGAPPEVLFFHQFSSFFEQHAVYFALYLALSIFSLTHFYLKGINDLDSLRFKLALLAIPILIISLLLTASKAVIISFLFLYTAQVLYGLNLKLRNALFVLMTLICLLSIQIPLIKNRFLQGLEYDMKDFKPTNNLKTIYQFGYEERKGISDLELRNILAKVGTFHLIADQRYLFGYGMGDVQHYLDYYYMTYNLAPNWFEGHNLHNQYLQIFVSMGILALLLFIAYLMYSLHIAIKYRNQLHLIFLLMMMFVFMFECILSRNKGIVFFIFFNTLFLFNPRAYESGNYRD